jgi:hypothetical protein
VKRRCHIDDLIDYTEEKDISMQKEIEIKEHIKSCPECGEKYNRLKFIENYCSSTVEAPAEIYGNIMNGIDIERYSDKNFNTKMKITKVRRLAKPLIAVAAIFILVFNIYTNKNYLFGMGKEILAALNTKPAESLEEKVIAGAEYNSKDTISTRDLDQIPNKSIIYLKGRNGIKYFSTNGPLEPEYSRLPLSEIQVKLLEQELLVNFTDYVHFNKFTYIVYYLNGIRYEAKLYSNAKGSINCDTVATSSKDEFIENFKYPMRGDLNVYQGAGSKRGEDAYAYFHITFKNRNVFDKAYKISLFCKGEEFTKTIHRKETFIVPIPADFMFKNYCDIPIGQRPEWSIVLYDKNDNEIYEGSYYNVIY